MKIRFVLSLLLSLTLLLTACQPLHPNQAITPVPRLTRDEQRNIAVVQQLYAQLALGNSKVVLEVYPAQYTKHFAGQAGQMARVHAYDEQSALRLSLPDLHTEIANMFSQGDLVVTEMNWTAALQGDFLGTPTTSPRYHHRGLIVRRLQEGKIVEEWDLFDNLSLLQSLGYLPPLAQIIAQGPTGTPIRPPAPADAVFAWAQTGLTAQERQHQHLVQQLYEAYTRGYGDTVGEIFAEHVKIHQAGQVKVTTAAQLQQEFTTAKQANPTLQPMVHSFAVQGDLAVVELTWIGVHTGAYLNIPATGRTIVRDGLVVYRLQAGRIVESWELWEDLGFLQSVGYLSSWNTIIAHGPLQGGNSTFGSYKPDPPLAKAVPPIN